MKDCRALSLQQLHELLFFCAAQYELSLRKVHQMQYLSNPLQCRGNYSATLNNMQLMHLLLMVGCYIWYSKKGRGRAVGPVPSMLYQM